MKHKKMKRHSRLAIPKQIRTTRDIIREHLVMNRLYIRGDLSRMLGMQPQSAASFMTKKFPIAPHHVEAICKGLNLDEFDSGDLWRQAAREWGFKIDGPRV